MDHKQIIEIIVTRGNRKLKRIVKKPCRFTENSEIIAKYILDLTERIYIIEHAEGCSYKEMQNLRLQYNLACKALASQIKLDNRLHKRDKLFPQFDD